MKSHQTTQAGLYGSMRCKQRYNGMEKPKLVIKKKKPPQTKTKPPACLKVVNMKEVVAFKTDGAFWEKINNDFYVYLNFTGFLNW